MKNYRTCIRQKISSVKSVKLPTAILLVFLLTIMVGVLYIVSTKAGQNQAKKPPNFDSLVARLNENGHFYKPSGFFFQVTLFTGLDAPAAPDSSSKPHPVLLAIQDFSWLPDEVRQKVSGCFISAEAYGEPSVGRAYIRGVSLSCVNAHNETVIEEPIFGYVADIDGKLGMRGSVVRSPDQFKVQVNEPDMGDTSMAEQHNEDVGSSKGAVPVRGSEKIAESDLGKPGGSLSDCKCNQTSLPLAVGIEAKRKATFIFSEGKHFIYPKKFF